MRSITNEDLELTLETKNNIGLANFIIESNSIEGEETNIKDTTYMKNIKAFLKRNLTEKTVLKLHKKF